MIAAEGTRFGQSTQNNPLPRQRLRHAIVLFALVSKILLAGCASSYTVIGPLPEGPGEHDIRIAARQAFVEYSRGLSGKKDRFVEVANDSVLTYRVGRCRPISGHLECRDFSHLVLMVKAVHLVSPDTALVTMQSISSNTLTHGVGIFEAHFLASRRNGVWSAKQVGSVSNSEAFPYRP